MNEIKGTAFKPPYPALELLPFLAGGLIYVATRLSGRAAVLGVQLGLIVAVLTWFYVRYLRARAVLERLEEELRSGKTANAPAMLAFVRPRIIGSRVMIRKYLELRTMAALQTAFETGIAHACDPAGAAGPSAPMPRLSWPAITLACLAPLFFLTFFFLTLLDLILPFLNLPSGAIGLLSLVPAASGAALALFLLTRRGASRHDKTIAWAGLLLALLAFAAVATGGYALRVFPGFAPRAGAVADPWPARIAGYLALVLSIMLHECAHGLAAYYSGDPTAKNAGRISLNPIRHIDPIGTILLPALLSLTPGGFIFGWAKPVPVDLSRLRHARRGRLAVSLAGVGVNLLLALVCSALLLLVGVFLRLRYPGLASSDLPNLAGLVALSGLPWPGVWQFVLETLRSGIMINLVLFNLNILPIPPLDGYGAVESLTPSGLRRFTGRVRLAGMAVVLLLVATGALDYLLYPAVYASTILVRVIAILAKLG